MCPETDILEQEKKAVADMIAVRAITPDNAVFERTGGGFVRMAFTVPNGTVEGISPGYRSIAVSPFPIRTATFPSGNRRRTEKRSA